MDLAGTVTSIGSVSSTLKPNAGKAVNLGSTVDTTANTLYGVAIEVLRASDGRLVVVGAPDLHGHHAH